MTSIPDFEPEIEALQVVLVGSFNPQIFQPAWFAAQGILVDVEAKSARIEIILPDVCAFNTDRISIHVDRERFIALAMTSKDYEALRDFVVATFRLLHHSPVRQVGLNLNVHVRVTPEIYARIETRLTQPSVWTAAGLLERRLQDIAVLCARTDGRAGHLNVRVQPSRRVEGSAFYIQINDHYEVVPQSQATTSVPLSNAQLAADLLEDCWFDSVTSSRQRVQALLKGASE